MLPQEWIPPSDDSVDGRASPSRVVVMVIAVGAMLVVLLAGVALVSRAVFVDHRDARQARVLAKYSEMMRGCVAGGTSVDVCSAQVYSDCLADPFWSQRSFATLWISDGGDEATTYCGSPAAVG
ncbi:hypothetical protein SAMN05892883_2376 [Jatrophihabitans sp. GAS493]|nr:hypothetical protein SAMN05892883_2376 [Jatrophihabitans sp. GAS493]